MQDATNLSIKKDKVNQQMADKNLIGGKYTVNLSNLQVFWQKSDFFRCFCRQNQTFCMFFLKKSAKNLQDWKKLNTFAAEQDKTVKI